MSEEAVADAQEKEKKSYTGSFAGPVLVFSGVIVIIISTVYGMGAYQNASSYGMGEIILLYTGAAIISGLLIAGFGTVIKLLREINSNQLNK